MRSETGVKARETLPYSQGKIANIRRHRLMLLARSLKEYIEQKYQIFKDKHVFLPETILIL
jgi:hypothetical protein